jgi:Zn-dependent peptidase ImmA (M78 family)/transcriptional regulator with XRE-family HTH domain
MPSSAALPINPQLLTWAREESGFEVFRVAKRLNVKHEKVEAWEAGKRQPTLRQVEKLARFFHRPLSVFFLPKPPQLPPLAAEYRRLPDVIPGHESPELRLALRQMLTRRENTLNLLGELGEPVQKFSLSARLGESPAQVGARLRAAAGISSDEQRAWPSEWRAWATWRAAVENLGLLVFQFTKVTLGEVRGLALLRTPLPVVGVNSKEIPEARCFTVMHEVVHLMLAAGHEEMPAIQENRSGADWKNVERFAEEAASHALVSETFLRSEIEHFGLIGSTWDIDSVRRLARRFRITPLATATRLRESGFMSWARYRAWRQEWDTYIEGLPKRSGGFATPVSKAIGRNGRPFAQLVLEALSANRITPVTASRYLDLKFEHFDKLRAAVREGGMEAPVDG